MKNIRIIVIFIVVPSLFLNSCDVLPWGCITGNHRIATENRAIGEFSSIASYGSYVVNVETGSDYSLSVETDENLLSYIRTNIRGNTLIIETRNGRCIKSREPIVVNVQTRAIEELKLAGSGVINANNFTADQIELELSGSGKIECDRITIKHMLAEISGSGVIELGGTSETADYLVTGSGIIRGVDLVTDRCFANITGSGNIYTHVLESLDVRISGSGSVYYEGDPEIQSNISGSGNVRRYK